MIAIRNFLLVQLIVGIALVFGWTRLPGEPMDYLQQYPVAKRFLESTDREKQILLVGGSSLSFSVSAKTLSEALRLPVYNTGYHAGVGYKKTQDYIGGAFKPERDILVYSPEFGFIGQNPEYSRVYCALVFVLTVRLAAGAARKPSKFYDSRHFNDFGEITAHLEPEDHRKQFDPVPADLPTEEELKLFLQHIEGLRGEGFEVHFIPPMVDQRICTNWQDMERILQAVNATVNLEGAKHIEITRGRVCRPTENFFDTAYHMNEIGRRAKTEAFRQEISSLLKTKAAR